ncbi:MAG TPA: CDP-diacylglycerol--glycerol-3-phosphate 3-phosphatidyltransferase [Terriglobia bacterium]|nr:CDP-diacylglycerol--glycerol-3-phosphate 3-phosphatidyltransferase [Terriglobia bacterium]
MSLPNSLTILRIFFVPLLVVLLLTTQPNMDLWAVGVFLAAATTDLLDGYFARRRAQISRLGTLLDPIADKLLTSAAFISLVELHRVPAWIVVIIVGREFAVSGLRAIASSEGFIIQASDIGKTKMVLQVAAITALMLEPRFAAMKLPEPALHLLVILTWLLLVLVVVSALVSAAHYFWRFWHKLDPSVRQPVRHRVVVLPDVEANLEDERKEKDVAAH